MLLERVENMEKLCEKREKFLQVSGLSKGSGRMPLTCTVCCVVDKDDPQVP